MHTTSQATSAPLAGITGRRVLGTGGIGPATLGFQDGCLTQPALQGPQAGPCLDAGDLLVLPGIVDIHGDAFERAVMPRPGVSFPYATALLDVDRQLLAHGITTEFHGVTLSWEGGLRGEAYALRMFEALAQLRPVLGAGHMVHLRFEAHHLEGVETALAWMEAGRVGLLAINDHLPTMAQRIGDERKVQQYAERAECDAETFRTRLRTASRHAQDVPAAMSRLIAAARAAGLPVASHDDPDLATRQHHHRQGCRIAEFPLTVETAHAARQLGDDVVFGAPNVMRGTSHTGAPNATEMVSAGLCTVLASDYYYPAPLQAAFKLAQLGVVDLPGAWKLVSRNPARAAGLRDRGALIPGLRADAIVVDDRHPGLPRVVGTIVGGELKHAAMSLPMTDIGGVDVARNDSMAA
ncbi:alpha-D-ribose 1-methylphosphonate 5-triphosphate diphosphatase [Cupriavidus numazuensis]|uniref:Alpha-D-ribose 1-methylphosphonate 5-triphosphate diphosphatase n=1 Tax=Cupriavidus numazuensis TaxID=221992 RepID=A0ABM8TKH6_9BURK|nr:alpha-D-ribose 1-methylphosphonate 5-triphosphate diphosphatase [Cupriavidus numazuensis]CAG2151797.1 Alpha-D-ribose 1-methylphosphonate 5-triphosphate diphosphatase [Cupriavidus numazuensis]